MNVKDVKKNMSLNKPTESDSVPIALPRFQLDLNDHDLQELLVKCQTNCKTLTRHQWLKVPVKSLEVDTNPLELLALSRRLLLCQNCGNIRLIK